MAAELAGSGADLPKEYQVARAVIVKKETSIENRKLFSGQEQYKQNTVKAVPFSNLLDQIQAKHYPVGTSLQERLVRAVMKTGFPRPKETVCKLWGGVKD